MKGPLGFVNWRTVNARFCLLMWLVAAVLAVVIVSHLGHPAAAVHPAAATVIR